MTNLAMYLYKNINHVTSRYVTTADYYYYY